MARPTRQEAIKTERRKRTPMGAPRKQLSLDDATMKALAGRVPRWVKDTDSNGQRLQQALDGDYDFVMSTGKEVVGDGVKAEESDRRIKKRTGTNKDGSTQYSYLMAIKKEFYEEDQALKEKENMKVDHAIKGGNPRGLNDHGINPEQGSTYVKNIDYRP